MGFDTDRITFSWVSAAEGTKWAGLVDEVTEKIREKGPFTEFKQLDLSTLEKIENDAHYKIK